MTPKNQTLYVARPCCGIGLAVVPRAAGDGACEPACRLGEQGVA